MMENKMIILIYKKEYGASIPIRLENRIRKNVSISLSPGEAMRSLESSPI